MSIRHPTRVLAGLCVALVAAPIGQAAAQAPYPAYGGSGGFGPGGAVANPHPRDLYNGATVATPGTFLDRFRQPDSTSGSVPCAPYGSGPGAYGQAGRGIQTPQSGQLGTFHDRFAEFRRPDPSEPSPGGGPGLDAATNPAAGCR